MPFKSEKQRRYLWANEPAIARDWTDTYGSKIHKADGGRIGFYRGKTSGTSRSNQGPAGGASAGGNYGGNVNPDQTYGRDRGYQNVHQTGAVSQTPGRTVTPKDTRDGILQKFKNYQNEYNTTARMKHIRSLNPNQIKALISKGLLEYDDEQPYGVDRLQDIRPTDLLSSTASLGTLRDQFGYTGGTNPAEDRGQQPYIYPPTGIASIEDTPATQTTSTLGSGDYQVPLNLVVNQQRAAEGGMIGSVGGMSRPKYQMGNMVEGEIEGAEMEGAMMQSEEVIKELYDALIAQGLSPQEAMEKIKQIIASTQTEGPQSPMMGEEFPGQEFGRAPAAFGGIMDTYTGRRKYGFGSIFKAPAKLLKKAVKGVKKLASSKLGKMALMYAAGTYLGGTQALGGTGQLSFAQRLRDPKLLANLINPTGSGVGEGKGWSMFQKATPVVQASTKYGAADVIDKANRLGVAADKVPWYKNPWVTVPAASTAAGLYTAMAPVEGLDDSQSEWDEDKAKWDAYYAGLGGDYRVPKNLRAAEGGRIGRQEGGLMDLGGMEKDYRNDGGFVPIGGQEKADDVPARLSRNEFVFTADAVRNAGGGDIDKGAEVMENVMKNLEGGGRISEESQGQGAQEMFEVSERLSEVM